MRFNGIDIRQAHRALSVAKEIQPGMPGRNLVTTNGAMGEVLAAIENTGDEYTVRVNIAGKTREEAWEAREALAAWARSSGDALAELEPTRAPGKAYSAIVKSIGRPEFVFGFGTVDVIFALPVPVMHDVADSFASATKKLKVDVMIGGTEPVQPIIDFECDSSGIGLLFRLDGEYLLRLSGEVNVGDRFRIDLQTGRVELDGSYIGPRIVYTDTDLDVMLRPGPHTIETNRTGNMTVRWKNQWA